MIVVEDAETGEQLTVDSSDAEFRHRLREAGEAREAELRELTLRAGVDIYEVSTEDDLVPALVRLVESRKAAAPMSLGSPWILLRLVVVPLLVVAYRSALRGAAGGRRVSRPRGSCRRRPGGVGGGATSRSRSSWRRSRSSFRPGPADREPCLPVREGTVILAFDVSNSMKAKDLEPSRIEAAKAAARAFVERQPQRSRSALSPSVTAPSPCSSRATSRRTCSRRSTGSPSAAGPRSARVSTRRSAPSRASR